MLNLAILKNQIFCRLRVLSRDLIDHFCPKGQFQVKKIGGVLQFPEEKHCSICSGIGCKKKLTYLHINKVSACICRVLGMFKNTMRVL